MSQSRGAINWHLVVSNLIGAAAAMALLFYLRAASIEDPQAIWLFPITLAISAVALGLIHLSAQMRGLGRNWSLFYGWTSGFELPNFFVVGLISCHHSRLSVHSPLGLAVLILGAGGASAVTVLLLRRYIAYLTKNADGKPSH
jgi:hypothetical protein